MKNNEIDSIFYIESEYIVSLNCIFQVMIIAFHRASSLPNNKHIFKCKLKPSMSLPIHQLPMRSTYDSESQFPSPCLE